MDILYTIVCVYVGEESVYVHDTALSFRRLIRRWYVVRHWVVEREL